MDGQTKRYSRRLVTFMLTAIALPANETSEMQTASPVMALFGEGTALPGRLSILLSDRGRARVRTSIRSKLDAERARGLGAGRRHPRRKVPHPRRLLPLLPHTLMVADVSSSDISVDRIERTCEDGSGKGVSLGRKPIDPSEFLPLPTATFHILLALRDEEKHGYAIMRDVEALSDGAVKIGPGTMYGSIKRMLAEGLIEESVERPDPDMDDERRRYYRCTGLGERVCGAEVKRLAKLLKKAFPRRAIPDFGPAR